MKSFTHILSLSFFLLLVSPHIAADGSNAVNPEVEYIVANAPVVPVREEPLHSAEQATQLLFGEVCERIERRSGWSKIRSTVDGQEGWITSRMLTPTSDLSSLSAQPFAVVTTPMAAAYPADGGAPLLLTLGTRLPNYSNDTCEVGGKKYFIDHRVVNVFNPQDPSAQSIWGPRELRERVGRAEASSAQCREATVNARDCRTRSDLIRIAHSLLNTPYLWGGKNVMGLDCSGFTQVVYAAIGVNLLRNAREQITQGEEVSSLEESLPGDLVFFDHSDRDPEATRISHVGMLLSPTEVIHCAGSGVHIDRIDANGIYLPDGTMTHHLVKIKRYL